MGRPPSLKWVPPPFFRSSSAKSTCCFARMIARPPVCAAAPRSSPKYPSLRRKPSPEPNPGWDEPLRPLHEDGMGRYGRSLVSSQASCSWCPFHAACCNRCITRVVASCRIVHARHVACCLVSCAGPFLGDLTAQDRNIWAAQRAEFEALSPQAHRKRHAARISCNRTGASWRAAERADA